MICEDKYKPRVEFERNQREELRSMSNDQIIYLYYSKQLKSHLNHSYISTTFHNYHDISTST